MEDFNLKKYQLEQQIETIKELLNELRNNQIEQLQLIKKNHITYMKKLDKLYEYDEIADMSNQVFEKRLCGIERNIRAINDEVKINEKG